MRSWGGYEPTMKAPKDPPTQQQLIFRAVVLGIGAVVLIALIIAGCEIKTNTTDQEIESCYGRGGVWTWDQDDSDDGLTYSKTCVIAE